MFDSASHGSKLLVPFGRILLAYQQDNIRLKFPIYVYIGREAKETAFAQTRAGTLCTFIPFEEDFSRYKFPITGQKIVVEDTGLLDLSYINKFCMYLLTFKPAVIFLYSELHPNNLILSAGSYPDE